MILGAETLTLRRTAAGTRGADGRFVEGATTETTFTGSVQPPPRRVLETLEEGERQRGAKIIFTKTQLRTGNQHTQTRPDIVLYDDGLGEEEWQVRDVQNWPTLLAHYQVTVVRVQEADS